MPIVVSSFLLPLTHLLTYSLTHLLTYSLTHLLIYSLTHLLTYSLTHSLTYSLIHSLTHSLICLHNALVSHLNILIPVSGLFSLISREKKCFKNKFFVDHSARYYPKYYWSYMGFRNVFFVKYNFKAEVASYYIVSFLRITFVSFIIGSQYKT